MRKAWRSPVFLLLALSLSACGAAQNQHPANGPQRPHTTVEVTNNNWSDVVVYLVRSTNRIRLGMVTSMNTLSFRVPPMWVHAGSSLRLEARPIGAQNPYVTPSLQVSPGQRIELMVQNHMNISSVAVR